MSAESAESAERAENADQIQKRRLILPWRSPEIGEGLYLALVKLVIIHQAHVASRARVTKVWEEVARDFWKQPEVDIEKYEMVSVKQLRNIYNNLIASRGERFRQGANTSGACNDPTIGDRDLSPLDERIKEIVVDEENAAADEAERKRKAREIAVAADDNETTLLFRSLSGGAKKKRKFKKIDDRDEHLRIGTPSSTSSSSNHLGTLDEQLMSALLRPSETTTANISEVEELLLHKFGTDIDAQQALEEHLGVNIAEFVVKEITMPVVITVFCESDHAFKLAFFKEQMVGCGMALLDAIKLYTILKRCMKNDDMASD